ncbi:MAG: DUF481 domain-containing protein [Kofleriaceae bacterium]
MTRLGLATALVCAVASSAFAQNPKFEFGKAEEVAKVKGTEYEASAEAGIVFTTGNSETTTFTAGAKASRKTGKNKLSAEGSITYARSGIRVLEDLNGNGEVDNIDEIRTESTTTAQALAIKVRYDRFLTEFNSLFVAALASRDLPAGKENVLGAQLGYSRQLYKSKTAEAVGEFGYDYAHEDLVAGDAVQIHSARAFVGFKADLTEGATFETSVEALTNLNHETLPTRTFGADFGEDTRVNFKAAVSAKIGKSTSVQTSIEAKYDNRPAPLSIKGLAMGFVPEASKLDTIMKASFIYTFF